MIRGPAEARGGQNPRRRSLPSSFALPFRPSGLFIFLFPPSFALPVATVASSTSQDDALDLCPAANLASPFTLTVTPANDYPPQDQHIEQHPQLGPFDQPVGLPSYFAHFFLLARSSITGAIRSPALPSFAVCWNIAMASSQSQIPSTPRVISPSPTPSESKDEYFGPTTRSKARSIRLTSPPPVEEESSGSEADRRARARSRSPLEGRKRRISSLTTATKSGLKTKNGGPVEPNGTVNGHLSPASAQKASYWRAISRSPSPLGLIPIHARWRSFVSL